MANFRVHEDPASMIENVRPKYAKPAGGCFPALNKNRGVLQTLCGYQQNAKTRKPDEEQKSKKGEHTKTPGVVSNLCSDLIIHKTHFNRVHIFPRAVSPEKEYEDHIWTYLNELEKRMHVIKPHYMTKQANLTWGMRSVLIDWLVSVADEYSMNENTLHLSVNYLDRFLSNISVIREKFQLVGATAMMIAGKMEELYPPDTKEWSYLTGDAFHFRQFIKMELLMLKVLNFEMNPPTILDFIRHLCAKHKLDKQTLYLAMYLGELVLLEGDDYLKHFPSKLAASSLFLARHTLSKPEPWTKKLEEAAGYTAKQLSPVVQKQHSTFKSSPFKEQQAIQKKYASPKYQRVALLKPRTLKLDEE